MDITPTNNNTLNTNTNSKSPETDTTDNHQTGATRIHSAKPLTFTNGVLKRHQPQPQHHQRHHHHHHHHPIVVTYKECLKNHAASIGGHALDGCGEFMPSPTATPSDPTSLKCAACGCHRNFHRREPDQDHHLPHVPTTATTATIEYQPHHRHHPPPPVTQPPSRRSPSSASPPPISSSYYPSAPHMLLALSGNLQQSSAAAAVPQENHHISNNHHHNNNNIMMSNSGGSSGGRKRFRTKFSQSQKEKMFEFAERVGWKMQKRDDDLVHEFCNEVVWMHNNKSTFAKRDLNGAGGSGSGSAGGGIGRINLDDDNTGNDNINNSKSGDGDDQDEEEGINNNNNGVRNLNHQFGSATESAAHVANANGGSSSSS
ncbi:hypothetical protein CISIN_1g016972mg [Citrus sinensis]|uniref:ZF-HD dimerization-type domain-containing protein n=1 Tax=Citrus sinensis TaxID=2711 RepID=A0A067GAM0_CITSI|nr:hypothetical protein CISIN_1g016972mg [Citrus sinensis]